MERFRELEVPELELRVLGLVRVLGRSLLKHKVTQSFAFRWRSGVQVWGSGNDIVVEGASRLRPGNPKSRPSYRWRFRVLDLQIPENLFRSGAQTVATSNAPGLSD